MTTGYRDVWRYQQAPVASDELADLLAQGWEPFSVTGRPNTAGIVHLRKPEKQPVPR